MTKFNLGEFLNSEKERGLITQEEYSNYYTNFIKINSGIEHLKLIYELESTDEEVLPIFKKLEFLGIYDRKNKTFYHSFISMNDFKKLDVGDIKMIKIGELYYKFIEDVKLSISSKIGYDESKIKGVSLTDKELEDIKKYRVSTSAYETFMKDEKINKDEYIELYHFPKLEYSNSLLLLYLNNSEKIINKKAEEYINEYKEYIYKNIITNKMIEKEIKELEKDETMCENKKIYSILTNVENMKTVNVEFLKNRESLSCKVEVVKNSFDYINAQISSYNIPNKSDRDKFEEMFKDERMRDASFDDITKIIYSRKVLYSRD